MFLIWNCLNDLLGFSHFLLKKWPSNKVVHQRNFRCFDGERLHIFD